MPVPRIGTDGSAIDGLDAAGATGDRAVGTAALPKRKARDFSKVQQVGRKSAAASNQINEKSAGCACG